MTDQLQVRHAQWPTAPTSTVIQSCASPNMLQTFNRNNCELQMPAQTATKDYINLKLLSWFERWDLVSILAWNTN